MNLDFMQVKGEVEKPEGFALFYVPIVSNRTDNMYRAVFGITLEKTIYESPRFWLVRDQINIDDASKEKKPISMLRFLKDGSLIHRLDKVGGWDIFRANNAFQVNYQDEVDVLDGILTEFSSDYLKNYFDSENQIRDDETLDDIEGWGN
jgi:hypothetical protein